MSDRSLPLEVCRFQKNQTEEVRVALDEYRGSQLIDARVLYQDNPTRKGLALRPDLVPQLIAALSDAYHQAVEMGWVEPRAVASSMDELREVVDSGQVDRERTADYLQGDLYGSSVAVPD